jgi:hypothetical protein
MKFLHLSKELHSEPVFALGSDGNPTATIASYRFVLHRGDGKTLNYGRNERKRRQRAGKPHWQWRQVR